MNNTKASKRKRGRLLAAPPLFGTYSEDGWIATVQVIADTSDAEWQRYKLKVIETHRPPGVYKTPRNGNVFSVDQRKNAGAWGGMWTLELLPNAQDQRRAAADSKSPETPRHDRELIGSFAASACSAIYV